MTTFSDPGFRVTGPDDDDEIDAETSDEQSLEADLDEAELLDDDAEFLDDDTELSDDVEDTELGNTDLDDADLVDDELDDTKLNDHAELLDDTSEADDDVSDDIGSDDESDEPVAELDQHVEDPAAEHADLGVFRSQDDDDPSSDADVATGVQVEADATPLDETDAAAQAEDGESLTTAELSPEPETAPQPETASSQPEAVPPQPETAKIRVAYQPPLTEALEPPPFWSMQQLFSVGQRALAVLAVMGLVGYGLGALRGDSHIARAEFVYTLDESVPDSFLREDRRLLTQVVTFKSDAVLTPVAEQFDLSVDQLRSKIDVETLDLSEVLRLDVSDSNEERAIAISQAVLNRYLQVITDASPAGDSSAELAQRRTEVAAQLEQADEARKGLLAAQRRDVSLSIREDSIQRDIDLRSEQLNRIQASLDGAPVGNISAAEAAALDDRFEATRLLLDELEADLVEVGGERVELSAETTAQPALLREIDRLETVLDTIDGELSQRELAPLVASPIRELSEPIVLVQSRHAFGLQGMALGLLVGLPLAALLAYRTRQRQLWFD